MSNTFETSNKLYNSLKKVIRGKDETLKLILTSLFADGHILIEDYPGSGKTTLAKTLGRLISSSLNDENIKPYRRIQFTPDLLPGDVLGVNIFETETSSFKFLPGPVFAHIVLADEINRTGPKVQAAFLECMAEKQVTLDNKTYQLDDLFFVIGTQNPLDLAGTYPLPLVQLDRFLLKIPMGYVDSSTELEILNDHNSIAKDASSLEAVCSRDEILEAREFTNNINVHPHIQEAIIEIVQKTRSSEDCPIGLSTRAAIMMKKALQAFAFVSQRDYITEDDLKFLAPYVFSHRMDPDSDFNESSSALNSIINDTIDNLVKKGFSSKA